jgi:hypothetical protein
MIYTIQKQPFPKLEFIYKYHMPKELKALCNMPDQRWLAHQARIYSYKLS